MNEAETKAYYAGVREGLKRANEVLLETDHVRTIPRHLLAQVNMEERQEVEAAAFRAAMALNCKGKAGG